MGDPVITQPMQWASIPDIDDVPPLSAADHECLKEIRDVLAKYNNLERIGINLIHKHFEIGADECLVEFIDVENRTLTVKPVKKAAVGTGAVETQWQLATGNALLICEKQCITNIMHSEKHLYRPSITQ